MNTFAYCTLHKMIDSFAPILRAQYHVTDILITCWAKYDIVKDFILPFILTHGQTPQPTPLELNPEVKLSDSNCDG
jgi:hypothetical protein